MLSLLCLFKILVYRALIFIINHKMAELSIQPNEAAQHWREK